MDTAARLPAMQSNRRYQRWAAYGQSKLANLLFMYELQRKFAAADVAAIAVAAHPGYADTNLQSAHARATGSGLEAKIMGVTNRILGQPASMGALPELYALFADFYRQDPAARERRR